MCASWCAPARAATGARARVSPCATRHLHAALLVWSGRGRRLELLPCCCCSSSQPRRRWSSYCYHRLLTALCYRAANDDTPTPSESYPKSAALLAHTGDYAVGFPHLHFGLGPVVPQRTTKNNNIYTPVVDGATEFLQDFPTFPPNSVYAKVSTASSRVQE